MTKVKAGLVYQSAMLRFSHACSRTLLTASCLIASGHGFAQTGSIVSPTYTAGSTVTIQPGADSTSAVQIANHAGTPVASVDTTNNRVIVGSGLPSNALVVGMEATASTLVPASTIEIGNTGANSVLTLGQSASARLSMAWNYTGQSGTITTQGVQPLNLQSNGGPVVLGGGFATKRVVTAVSYTATSGDCIIGFSAVPSGASVTCPPAQA